MKLQWYGTASISIDTNNEKILFDPFIPFKESNINIKLEDFLGYDKIFITHGHFDHIGSLELISKNQNLKIYCTQTPYNTLITKGISKEKLIKIKPGDIYTFGDENNSIQIKVYQGKHIDYDKLVIGKILLTPRTYKYVKNALFINKENKRCPENNETVIYQICVEKKNIIIMGSLGLDKNTSYPINCDLLFLPYQGNKKLFEIAQNILNVLEPKQIVLTHYDDTFPPISKNVDTSLIENLYADRIKRGKYKEIIKFKEEL